MLVLIQFLQRFKMTRKNIFSDATQFSNFFNNQTGISPSEFRNV